MLAILKTILDYSKNSVRKHISKNYFFNFSIKNTLLQN